jgi:hypothetical protein
MDEWNREAEASRPPERLASLVVVVDDHSALDAALDAEAGLVVVLQQRAALDLGFHLHRFSPFFESATMALVVRS